jgi:DNA-binding Lrp family transcriptional regulator
MMNKENILIFNFEANKPPVFKEERGKDYIVYGTEAPYKNLYPDYLVELYNTSGKHNSIVNGKTNYISGRGWKVDQTVRTLEDKVKLENFINHVGNDSLFELTKKIVKDNELFGGYALEVIVTKDGKGLIINHIDFGDIRVGVEEDTYFYTSDWASRKPTSNEDFETLTSFPFDGSAVKGERYICYYKSYRPNLKEYPLPNYISGINYIKSDYEVSNYVLNSISNGYSGGTIWNFHNGQPTQEAQAYIKKQIKNKHHGSNNAGEPVIIFDDGKDKGVEIISTNPNGQDDKFINLNQQIQDEIFTAHGVDASVFIKTIDTGFSNNADELRVAIEAMNSSYIEPNQIMYEKLFNDFVVLLGMPSGLKIEKIAPISTPLSENALTAVMTTAEIREMAGLPPLKAEEQSGGAADALATLSPLVATKVLDNMTAEEIRGLVGLKGTPTITRTESKFNEDEEFKFDLSEFGYAEDELEVISEKELDYNPFDFADIGSIDSQIIDIVKATPKVTVEEIGQQVGETPSEVQERIDRLVKNGLLDLTKTKIKVTDEGERETSELITVYKYKLRHDAPSLRGGRSRDFCRKLMKENRSYELKDILAMNNKQGSNVFAHRGGWYNNPVTKTRTNYCRHVWSARTVRLKQNA